MPARRRILELFCGIGDEVFALSATGLNEQEATETTENRSLRSRCILCSNGPHKLRICSPFPLFPPVPRHPHLPSSGPLPGSMRLECFGSRDSGLGTASLALPQHQLFERREVLVLPSGELADVATDHGPFQLDVFTNVNVKVRQAADHVDGVHPPQRRRRPHGCRAGLMPARGAEPGNRFGQLRRCPVVRMIVVSGVGQY